MSNARDLLEPATRGDFDYELGLDQQIQLSIAVSLKRIADVLSGAGMAEFEKALQAYDWAETRSVARAGSSE